MNFSDQGTLVVVLKYSQKLSRTNFAFIEKLFSHCFEIDLKQSFISNLLLSNYYLHPPYQDFMVVRSEKVTCFLGNCEKL